MKKLLFITLSTVFCSSVLLAQDSQKEMKETKYRRSSLHTILIESSGFPKKDQVINAYYGAPFPDKYDNHNIGAKSFNPAKYTTDTVDSQTPEVIEKYFKDEQIAKKMGIYLVNSINPFRLEGQKTVMYRVLEALRWESPDWIVVPGGNLGNSSAFGKAFIRLRCVL